MPSEPTIASVVLDHLEGQGATAQKTTKPWGWEHTVATDDFVAKVIIVKDGHKTSLQTHVEKDEIIMPFSGNGHIEVRIGWSQEDEGIVRAGVGSSVRLRPGVVHRAVGPLAFIEFSTPQLDDVVRIQDDYSR